MDHNEADAFSKKKVKLKVLKQNIRLKKINTKETVLKTT